MPLRPVSELGLIDATDVSPVSREVNEPAPSAEPANRSPTPRPSRGAPSSNGAAAQTGPDAPSAAPVSESEETPLADESAEPNDVTLAEVATAAHKRGEKKKARRVEDVATAGEPGERRKVPLADEPPTFLQVMVPGELHERLADVSHALAVEHRKLRHHKTILGALIWRYVDPSDPQSLGQLGAALDGYLGTDLAEAPAEIKVGAHLPFSLKHKLDGAAIALRRTRRDASAKTLLSALIWRYVDPHDSAPLVELLGAYHDVVRPRPLPLT